MKFDEFDGLMRRFEAQLDERVPRQGRTVLRLDGRGFTRLTKDVLAFARPFDDRFNNAMKKTCEHLMQAGIEMSLCYTQSDEISLLLAGPEVPFGGKSRKLNSIMAGEASACFSLNLNHLSAFDCRVVPLPDNEAVIDYFRWRAEDAKRNGLTAFCYWGLRAQGKTPSDADKRLKGMTTKEKHILLSQLGIELDAEPDWKTHGSFLNWRDGTLQGSDPRTGSMVETTRRRLNWISPTPQGNMLSTLLRGWLGVSV